MKKFLSKITACLCAIVIFASCIPQTFAVENTMTKTTAQCTANHKKVTISAKKIKLNGKSPRIKIKIKNESNKYLSYGRAYGVYRKTKNGKVDCSTTDHIWTCDMVVTNAKKHIRTFSLKGYDLSKKGTYILQFGFYIGNASRRTAKIKFKIDGQ